MPMTSTGNELLSRLAVEPALTSRGFTVELTGIRTVMISHGGYFHGIWRRVIGAYEWIPAGYSTPQYCARSAAEAVRHTVDTLCIDETAAVPHEPQGCRAGFDSRGHHSRPA